MRMLWVSPQGKQLVIETLDTVLDTIDHRWPDGDGWAPLFDQYYENENDPRMIPTRRLVPVTKRVGGAFEDRVDLEKIDETDEIDDSNEADQD